ncbi:unnamed protein product [Arabis nemorensis]|uniref:Uncharacterized protein n=1 Tax=Arabis nemorensis TaxID=586526 RepID=A0A565CFU1_9BRAS|nr:unnamed protein product [Arabis nemorensis]
MVLQKIVSGRQLEFACDDFVRDQPELLEKIGERYAQMLILDRLNICKNTDEEFLFIKSEENEKALAIKDLEELREDAIPAIDHFRNQVLPKLKNHINQENDIQKLRAIIEVLNEFNSTISDLMKSNDRDGSNLLNSSLQNFHLSSL